MECCWYYNDVSNNYIIYENMKSVYVTINKNVKCGKTWDLLVNVLRFLNGIGKRSKTNPVGIVLIPVQSWLISKFCEEARKSLKNNAENFKSGLVLNTFSECTNFPWQGGVCNAGHKLLGSNEFAKQAICCSAPCYQFVFDFRV